MLFFVGQQAEGLVAAAQAGLLLTSISNVLIDIDADVAMQYSPISTRGPVSNATEVNCKAFFEALPAAAVN